MPRSLHPIFEEAARRDLTILMHPTRGADFAGLQNRGKIALRNLVDARLAL